MSGVERHAGGHRQGKLALVHEAGAVLGAHARDDLARVWVNDVSAGVDGRHGAAQQGPRLLDVRAQARLHCARGAAELSHRAPATGAHVAAWQGSGGVIERKGARPGAVCGRGAHVRVCKDKVEQASTAHDGHDTHLDV